MCGILIESTMTTSMEDVSTGVLEKIKNIQEVKIKPKMIWCIKTYIIAYAKMKKNEDILSIMSNLQPNCCLKIDFQKVDQHAGGTLRMTVITSGRFFTRLEDLPKWVFVTSYFYGWKQHTCAHRTKYFVLRIRRRLRMGDGETLSNF